VLKNGAELWFSRTFDEESPSVAQKDENPLENESRCASWWSWIIESAGEPELLIGPITAFPKMASRTRRKKAIAEDPLRNARTDFFQMTYDTNWFGPFVVSHKHTPVYAKNPVKLSNRSLAA